MAKDVDRKPTEDEPGKAYRLEFDIETGKERRVKLSQEEIDALDAVPTFEDPITPTIDKEALAKAIDDCKNLERLKDLLIRDILPLL